MTERFPPIEPFETGMLDVGEGHRVYWECSGSPHGRPAVVLHGGPGGGSFAGARRFFDPTTTRIVQLDQRGCGKSRPLASDRIVDLSTHSTDRLVRDLEMLREHLGFERWTILGLSWGTTLGLAYAEAHPERVDGMVLALVTTTSSSEVKWITEDVGRLFPHAWHSFADVPAHLRNRPCVDAYAELLVDPDHDVQDRAASAWCAWEDAHVSLSPGHQPSALFEDASARLGFARLVTHYWRHAARFGHDALIERASRLDGIPGVLIHGRYDVSSPLETAWQLAQRWKTSELVVLDDMGHGNGGSFPTAVTQALGRLVRR